jgi:hypothetical protein
LIARDERNFVLGWEGGNVFFGNISWHVVEVPGDRKPEHVYHDVGLVFKQILISNVKVE